MKIQSSLLKVVLLNQLKIQLAKGRKERTIIVNCLKNDTEPIKAIFESEFGDEFKIDPFTKKDPEMRNDLSHDEMVVDI